MKKTPVVLVYLSCDGTSVEYVQLPSHEQQVQLLTVAAASVLRALATHGGDIEAAVKAARSVPIRPTSDVHLIPAPFVIQAGTG